MSESKKKVFRLIIVAVVDDKPLCHWVTTKKTVFLTKMILNLIQLACIEFNSRICDARFKNLRGLLKYGLKVI